MKITTLLETYTTLSTDSAGLQSQQAPKFGRDPHVLEDDVKLDETTSGAIATGEPTNMGMQRRAKGSMLQGIKTSKKFSNSAAVKESVAEGDDQYQAEPYDEFASDTFSDEPKDNDSVAESYPKHQDLSGISTDKLKAYLAKQGQQQSPGEGNQVKRVRAELQRRSQGVAEGVTPASTSKVLRLIQRHHPEWFDNYGMGEVEDTVVDMAEMGQFSGMSAADALELVGQELESMYGQQGVAEGSSDRRKQEQEADKWLEKRIMKCTCPTSARNNPKCPVHGKKKGVAEGLMSKKQLQAQQAQINHLIRQGYELDPKDNKWRKPKDDNTEPKKKEQGVAEGLNEYRVEINQDAPDDLYDIQDKLEMSRWKSSVKNVITSLFAKQYPGVQLFFKNTQEGNLFVTTDKSALASEDIDLYSDIDEFGASIIGPTAEYGVDDILYVGIGFDSIKSGKYKGIVGEMLNTIVPPLAMKFKAKPAIIIVVEDQSGGAWEAMANKLGWAFISGEDEQGMAEGQNMPDANGNYKFHMFAYLRNGDIKEFNVIANGDRNAKILAKKKLIEKGYTNIYSIDIQGMSPVHGPVNYAIDRRLKLEQRGVAEGSDGWIGNPAKWKEAVLQAHGPDVVFKNYSNPGQPGKRSVHAWDANDKIVGVYQRYNKMGMVQPNMQGVAEGSAEAPVKHHTVLVSYHKKDDPHRRYEARFKTTHNLGKEETEKRAKAAFAAKGKVVYNIVHEQDVAEGSKEDMSKEVKAMATGTCPHCHGPVKKKEHSTLTQYHCAKCGIRGSIDKQGVAEGKEELHTQLQSINQKLKLMRGGPVGEPNSMAFVEKRKELLKQKEQILSQLKQGVAEGPGFDKWADDRVASQLHKLKPRMVQDRKTGKWYDPKKEFDKKMSSPEVMAQMKRMAQKEGVAEGVAETLPMNDAVKVLRQYGADHFKTTSNELHFYKNGRPFSVDLIMNSDATRSVSLSQLNSTSRKLKGQGVAETEKYPEPEQEVIDATRRARMQREREPQGSEKIDTALAQRNTQLQQYNETGKFWLKKKDSQEHISNSYVGKAAANQAALQLLKQHPELKGNIVITAWGPGETPVNEAELSEEQLLARDLKKQLELFKKSVDHDLGNKPRDKELGKKPKDKEFQKK